MAPAAPADDPLAVGVARIEAAVGGTAADAPRARTAVADGGMRPGKRLAHFQLERPLGRGGMGEVWLSQDLALDRPVAVKVLARDVADAPSSRERFYREARAQARVLHANVGQASQHAAYSPCTVDDLAGTGHHYWALGHVHKRQILREHGPCIAYPGNLQGRSFKPSEHGPRGRCLSRSLEHGSPRRSWIWRPCGSTSSSSMLVNARTSVRLPTR